MSLSVDLRHRLGEFSLEAAFEAPAGITVLFGRSGSGKTTIMNSVAGLLSPDAGRIAVGDRVLLDTARGVRLPPHRRRIATVFQDARLFPHLTVRRNLLYGRRFAPKEAPAEDPGRVIDMLGIGHLLDRRPGRLSGGERQRVAIGRALLAAPSAILADEPLAALDDARKAEILPYFERLRDEVAVPVLYVTHSAAEVARLATWVVAVEAGRVAAAGPAAQVLGDPAVRPAGVRAVGAVLEARIVRHHADGLTELEAGGESLFLPRVAPAPDSRIRVRLPASDVILSRERPEGLSALNILPGTIEEVRVGTGPGTVISVRTRAGVVLARVTRRSVDALGFAPGVPCFAVIKTVSIAPEDISGR